MYSTRVLRAKFDSFVSPCTTLQAWLPSDKDLKKAKLSGIQIQHIRTHYKSEMLDITVLLSLLRNFCYKADLHNRLWDEKDNNKLVSKTGEIADIVRIRNLRNEVCMKHFMSKIHCLCTTKRGIFQRVHHSICKWGPVVQIMPLGSKLTPSRGSQFYIDLYKKKFKRHFLLSG